MVSKLEWLVQSISIRVCISHLANTFDVCPRLRGLVCGLFLVGGVWMVGGFVVISATKAIISDRTDYNALLWG